MSPDTSSSLAVYFPTDDNFEELPALYRGKVRGTHRLSDVRR